MAALSSIEVFSPSAPVGNAQAAMPELKDWRGRLTAPTLATE